MHIRRSGRRGETRCATVLLAVFLLVACTGCYTRGILNQPQLDRSSRLPGVEADDLLRLHLKGAAAVQGRFIREGADTLFARAVSSERILAISFGEIDSLFVHSGSGRRVGRALLGGAIGFAVVKGAFWILTTNDTSGDGQAALGNLAGSFWGAVIGAPLGAVTASIVTRDRWERVRIVTAAP